MKRIFDHLAHVLPQVLGRHTSSGVTPHPQFVFHDGAKREVSRSGTTKRRLALYLPWVVPLASPQISTVKRKLSPQSTGAAACGVRSAIARGRATEAARPRSPSVPVESSRRGSPIFCRLGCSAASRDLASFQPEFRIARSSGGMLGEPGAALTRESDFDFQRVVAALRGESGRGAGGLIQPPGRYAPARYARVSVQVAFVGAVSCTGRYSAALSPQRMRILIWAAKEHLLPKAIVTTADGLPNWRNPCSARMPGSRFTTSQDFRKAVATNTHRVIESRPAISSALSFDPSKVTPGSPRSWTVAMPHGGASISVRTMSVVILLRGSNASKECSVMVAYIYFAYDLELNGVKVGMTKNKVKSRITDELELIGAIEISAEDYEPKRLETSIHYCLRDHAIHGERFYPDKPVIDFVGTALSEGIECALSRHGDDAFAAIGFRQHYHKKMSHDQLRRSLRAGHPTRLYASEAWGYSQLYIDIGESRVRKREFLKLCSPREFRVFNSRLLSMKPNNTVAILVEDDSGSELIEVAAA